MPKRAIGLDISDFSIEATVLEKGEGDMSLATQNRVILEAGIVDKGRIKDMKALRAAMKEVLSPIENYQESENIIFGLPEAQVYTHVFRVPPDTNNLEKTVIERLETIIPIKKDKIYYSYIVRKKKEETNEKTVLVIATDYQVFTEWKQFFSKLGLSIKIFDIETLASFRGLYNKLPAEGVCLLDIGARTSQVAVFNSGGLIYSYTIPYAGDYFTKKIAQVLRISEEEAEGSKKKNGLNNKGRKGLKESLEISLKHLSTELKRNFDFLLDKEQVKVKKLVIIGGSSRLPGLLEYFKKTKLVPEITLGHARFSEDRDKFLYIESIGLAVRGLDNTWSKTDPAFTLAKPSNLKDLPQIVPNKLKDEINKFKIFIKKHTNKVAFGVIGLVIIALVANFIVSLNKRAKEPGLGAMDQYPFSYTLPFEIPVQVSGLAQNGYVRGRIVTDTVSEASQLNPAINQSRQIVQEKLLDSESLWPAPINKPEENESLIFPLTFKWLAIDESDLGQKTLAFLRKRQGPMNLVFDTFGLDELVLADKESTYILKGKIKLESADELNLADTKIIIPLIETGPEVQIANIDINLNVRAGPGTDNAIITQVEPGSKWPLLEEEGNWRKIELSDGQEGWVFGIYTEIIE